jgi:hypothetical protein
MQREILASGLFVLAGLLSGCGDGASNSAPAPETQAPAGGTSADQMKNMIGVPQAGGELKKE